MAITKSIRRDHAYVGATFSTARSRARGRQNVILAGGRVAEASPFANPGSIQIDPFIVEIDGLIIQSDAVINVAYSQPTTPGHTLLLVLSNPDDTDASGVTWTVLTRTADYTAGFIFAVRHDLGGSAGDAVWTQPPTASLRSIIHRLERPLQHRSERASSIDADRFRLDVDPFRTDSPVVVKGPATGIVAAALGAYSAFGADGGFVLPAAHHSYPRRDRLVLLRGGERVDDAMFGGASPADGIGAENAFDRHASIEVVAGVPRRNNVSAVVSAFSQTTVEIAGVASVNKNAVAADINKHIIPAAGAGTARDGSFTRSTNYNGLYLAYQLQAGNFIRFALVDPDRSTTSISTDGTTADASRSDLDIISLPDGGAVILYTSTAGAGAWDKLWMSKVDSAGAFTEQGKLVLDASTGTGIVPAILASAGIHRPKGYLDQDGNIQVVMQIEMDPAAAGGPAFDTAEALWWMKIDQDGKLLSQPVRLTDPASGVAPTAPIRSHVVQYVEGTTYVVGIRDTDLSVPEPEAIYLEFYSPSSVTTSDLSDVTTTAQVSKTSRSLEAGLFTSASVRSATLASDPTGKVVALFASADAGGGTRRRYIHYGPPSDPKLARLQPRSDGRAVSSIDLTANSDQLGASILTISEGSESMVAVHDGSAAHLVAWDAINSELVYERAVPHSLNNLHFAGEMTTAFTLRNLGGGGKATEPSSIVMVRGASGEPLVVRIPAAGADAGAVLLTEIYGIEGEPDPQWPDVTTLAEFDLPAKSAVDSTPTMAQSARVDEPAREIVVGDSGGLVGISGLKLALETLRGRGGTVRVRSGFYDLFQPIELTSGIEVRCDPGAIFRSGSPVAAGFLKASGATSWITAPDAEGIATISALSSHPRVAGFVPGTMIRNTVTGDEYYITEILEDGGKVRVSDTTMPAGSYRIMHTGIQWFGGTYIGVPANAIDLASAAHSRISGCHFKLGSAGSAVSLLRLSYCSDIIFEDFYGDLGATGRLHTTSTGGLGPNNRISIRNCRFVNGNAIGTLSNWPDVVLHDVALMNNTGTLTLLGTTSGHIDKIRGDVDMALSVKCSGRVVIGETDFSAQSDDSRTGDFNDTLNRPAWTDGLFRGNLYVSGFLNHGQYDLAILSLAMLLLDEQLFQLYGMVDGITEDFQNFDDLDSVASTYGRWYPGVAPLVLGGVAPVLPDSMVGYSDRVTSDYILDGFQSVTDMAKHLLPAGGALLGRHAAVRGVIHHDDVSLVGDFTHEGYPDRGKIEFQAAIGSAGETDNLVGELGQRIDELSIRDYTLFQNNLDGAGSDGDEITFSSVRYDRDAGISVGRQATVGGVFQWQRVYDAYTSLDDNRILVARTEIDNVGGTPWSLRLRVDMFEASTGDYVDGTVIKQSPAAAPHNYLTIHYEPGSGAYYGELSEVKIVPDLVTAGRVWVFFVGRIQQDNPLLSWVSAIGVAYVDLAAAPGAMLLDLPGEPAGTKWKLLETDSAALTRWRGLVVVPILDDFAASTADANNYAVAVMKTVGGATGTNIWLLQVGIFENPVASGATGFVGPMVGPALAGIVGFIPSPMANNFEMAGTGVPAQHLSANGAWAWRPLSGGSYISGGAPRLVVVLAYAPDNTTWVGSTLTAIRVSWGAAAAWNAPNAANVQAAGAVVDLSHFPGAIWDGPATRFLVPYAEGNAFGVGLHTQDSVSIDRVAWGGGPWVWAGPAVHRAMAAPTLRNMVSASLADQDDASASQRLNVAWQGEPAALATTWGGVQIDTAGAVTLGVWYDSALSEMASAAAWGMNLAKYWMSDREWDSAAELAAPTATDTLDREHFMLYHEDAGGLAGNVFLRCVGKKLAVKVEVDLPWGDNLAAMTLRTRGGGHTNAAGGESPGYRAFVQKGFRTSNVLANANAQPDQDVYDGAAGSILPANVDGYLAARNWTAAALRGAAGNIPNVAGANVGQRDIFAISLPNNEAKWTLGDRIIQLETTAAPGLLADPEDLESLMVGMMVEIDNNAVQTDHRITYFGLLDGRFAMVVEPPTSTAPDAVAGNNTYTFRKRVTGAVIVPLAGESTIVHPERIFLNQVELEAERLAVLQSDTVDTSPTIPPSSAVVLLSLIDVDGTLLADMAAGGASLSSYMTVELTRDGWVTADTVSFTTLKVGGPNPIIQSPMGDGSTLIIAYALLSWPIVPSSVKDLGYRITWVDGTYPGKRLHIDKVAVGWN